jgi:CubicO group peptidase (beta-lactamase class C family)
MVERVTGQGLPELLTECLFYPMGVDHAEWDRVASGADGYMANSAWSSRRTTSWSS